MHENEFLIIQKISEIAFIFSQIKKEKYTDKYNEYENKIHNVKMDQKRDLSVGSNLHSIETRK